MNRKYPTKLYEAAEYIVDDLIANSRRLTKLEEFYESVADKIAGYVLYQQNERTKNIFQRDIAKNLLVALYEADSYLLAEEIQVRMNKESNLSTINKYLKEGENMLFIDRVRVQGQAPALKNNLTRHGRWHVERNILKKPL